MNASAYLIVVPDPPAEDGPPAPLRVADEAIELADGVYLALTDLSRSRLYHRVKHQLPAGTALLVAPLADAPKFKGMAKGALAWIRERPLLGGNEQPVKDK